MLDQSLLRKNTLFMIKCNTRGACSEDKERQGGEEGHTEERRVDRAS